MILGAKNGFDVRTCLHILIGRQPRGLYLGFYCDDLHPRCWELKDGIQPQDWRHAAASHEVFLYVSCDAPPSTPVEQ